MYTGGLMFNFFLEKEKNKSCCPYYLLSSYPNDNASFLQCAGFDHNKKTIGEIAISPMANKNITMDKNAYYAIYEMANLNNITNM